MKKLIFCFTIVLLIFNHFSFSQTTAIVGDKSYKATDLYNLQNKIYFQLSYHTEKAGYLILTLPRGIRDMVKVKLTGDAFIMIGKGGGEVIQKNGTGTSKTITQKEQIEDVIKCTYSGISEINNDCSIRVYNISKEDLRKITSILYIKYCETSSLSSGEDFGEKKWFTISTKNASVDLKGHALLFMEVLSFVMENYPQTDKDFEELMKKKK